MSTENPYFHRGPIRKPDYFFGRTQEVTSVLSLVKNNQSVSIVGPRRIGKTSLLLHISHHKVLAHYGLSPSEDIFIFIDCGGLSKLNQAGFYRLILEETEDQLLDQGVEADLRIPEVPTYRQFERTLRRLSRQGLKLIYLFDEFELMSENHNLDADFFSGLRGLTARHNICYVTASQDHLLELSYADTGVLGSPFFNIFAVQHLGLFERGPALQLIREPSQASGITFSKEIIDFIWDLVGPHPMFLNIACFYTFAHLNKQPDPGADLEQHRLGLSPVAQEELRQKILDEVEGHLRYYWHKLDDRERQAMAALGGEARGETTQVLIHRLVQQGLVLQDNGHYRYPSLAWAEFVQRQLEDQSDTEHTIEPGVTLIGRKLGSYYIAELIGHGGMAQVYKGRHEALGRDVAIKVMLAHLAEDTDFMARFQREAQAVARLRHPHIVQVYDFGFQDKLSYMVMEYVAGGTLKDRLTNMDSDKKGLPLVEAIQLVRQIATALDYAHHCGIVHRDLKPANIMLNQNGQAVLTDFGLARLMNVTRYTASGTSWGTPAYMSPEQAQGERGDERSDIYSLGVILYELTTGHLPFEADTPLALLMKCMQEPVPPPRQFNPDLPEAIEQIILKTLAKNPHGRYRSAAELAQVLESQ